MKPKGDSLKVKKQLKDYTLGGQYWEEAVHIPKEVWNALLKREFKVIKVDPDTGDVLVIPKKRG